MEMASRRVTGTAKAGGDSAMSRRKDEYER